MTLTTAEKIRILCKRKNIPLSTLAKRLDMSSQNFSNKLARDNFPEKELIAIAKVLDCHYESHFILDDGEIF